MGMKNECLNEKTLLDILAGNAKLTAEQSRHVDECEQCAELFDRVMARALKVVEREFALTPTVSPHLSDEQLLLFYDHGINHAESETIMEHLAECSHCRRSFLQLKRELEDYYAGADLPAEFVEAEARQYWKKMEELLEPKPNGHTHKTWWERMIQVVKGEERGSKRKEGEGGGEPIRRFADSVASLMIRRFAIGAVAVAALIIIAFLIWRGQPRQEQIGRVHPKPRPQVPAPEKPKDIMPQPQPPKSPTGLKQPSRSTSRTVTDMSITVLSGALWTPHRAP